MPILQRTPAHRVTISGEDASADVVGITTSKTLRDPAGSFSVEMTQKHPWKDRIRPNDIVTIQIGDSSIESTLPYVCIGLVDRIGEVAEVGRSGKPFAGYRINGRDLGKLLIEHDLFWDASVAGILDKGMGSLSKIDFISGTASTVIERIYRKHFVQKAGAQRTAGVTQSSFLQDAANGVLDNIAPGFRLSRTGAQLVDDDPLLTIVPALQFGQGGMLSQQIQTDFQGTRGEKQDYAAFMESGDLWGCLRKNADAPWNELYTFTDPQGQYKLRLRPTPFSDDGRLSGVPVTALTVDDIVHRDLGRADHERVNFIIVYPIQTIYNSNATKMAFNAYMHDFGSIMQDGMRPQVLNSDYVHDDAEAEVKWRTDKAWGWLRRNHEYTTGSIRIRGTGRVVVGEGVTDPISNQTLYIEGVVQSYRINQPWVTTLQLTRGL